MLPQPDIGKQIENTSYSCKFCLMNISAQDLTKINKSIFTSLYARRQFDAEM